MSESGTNLSMSSVVSARKELLSTDLSDTELVLLDIDKGQYFGMESVANTIWKSISKPRTLDEVCSVLVDTYDTNRAEVESDALTFVNELIDAGLAQVDDGGS